MFKWLIVAMAFQYFGIDAPMDEGYYPDRYKPQAGEYMRFTMIEKDKKAPPRIVRFRNRDGEWCLNYRGTLRLVSPQRRVEFERAFKVFTRRVGRYH